MTSVIRMDTKALESLFPEGSEARVELQQAVIQNFTDRHLRVPDLKELKEMAEKRSQSLNDQWAKVTEEAINRYFNINDRGYGAEREAMHKFVANEVVPRMKGHIDTEMRQIVMDHIQSEEFEARMERHALAQATRRIEGMVSALADKQMGQLNEALAEQFSILLHAIFNKQAEKPNEPA